MSLLTTAARMWLTRSHKPFAFSGEFDQALPYAALDNLGLYVHIPFCRTLCSFCPYCKVPYQKPLADAYLAALLKEIQLVGQSAPGKKNITSLYFGGGSPALMAEHIATIITQINRYFAITDGIGIELHPADVTTENLQLLRKAGVTKICIGIQSFQMPSLHTLGRSHSDYPAMQQALQEVPFDTVSMDLIFALPGQTFEIIRQDIDTAFASGADHVAIYPFIDFQFTDSTVPALDKQAKRRLLEKITAYCASKGYVRDSIWTFAKNPRHSYSSMTRDHFLGFGCSATTLLAEQFKINTFSIEQYIHRLQNHQLPTTLTLRFTPRQRMVYYLFWTAYTMEISAPKFQAMFHTPLTQAFGLELACAQRLGYLTRHGDTYHLTDKGAFAFHYYENFYTLAYIDKMWGILRHEAFPKQLTL